MKKRDSIRPFFTLATSALKRLDAWLPPLIDEINWDASAYRWKSIGDKGMLEALPTPHTFSLDKLMGISQQKQHIIRNTEQFLAGRSANNVLLTGARGTGKSSLVKALLFEYHDQQLRLIEVSKHDLLTLPYLLTLLRERPEKYIIYCDDLAFEREDETFKALKTVLEGSLSIKNDNVLVYATSNRRHLTPEMHCDNAIHLNAQGEIHPQETIEQQISLSDRFGLWLHFYPFSQDDYLAAVNSWLEEAGLTMDETTRLAALQWAGVRGGRSGRVARQFVNDWAGRLR